MNKLTKTSLNLLLVEDSEDDAILMTHFLKSVFTNLFYKRVETKEELLETIESNIWDLIITDNALPQLSGSKAIELIRSKNTDVPIICVSGTKLNENEKESIHSGAKGFILKDNFDQLVKLVISVLEDYQSKK